MTRSTHRTVAAFFVAAAALLIASGCNPVPGPKSDDSHVLVYAAVPSQRPPYLEWTHQPIIEMLKKETGKDVRFQAGTDYAAIIEGLRAGKIDIAALGPLSYCT
ncbi:MAG: PhnD/SsuA/transferrin family substrate-binding protein [Pseudonocardiaceae bacterium]